MRGCLRAAALCDQTNQARHELGCVSRHCHSAGLELRRLVVCRLPDSLVRSTHASPLAGVCTRRPLKWTSSPPTAWRSSCVWRLRALLSRTHSPAPLASTPPPCSFSLRTPCSTPRLPKHLRARCARCRTGSLPRLCRATRSRGTWAGRGATAPTRAVLPTTLPRTTFTTRTCSLTPTSGLSL